jgi:CBS-domain-containing membrane protein
MSEHQVRRLPVLNKKKHLIGVIALADLAQIGSDAARIALKGISEPSGAVRR